MSYKTPSNPDHLLNMVLEQPHFCVISISSDLHKNLYLTKWYCYNNFIYCIITVIELETFHIVKHTYAVLISIKTHFYETNNHMLYLSKNKQSYIKQLTVSERTLNIETLLRWTFLLILLTSGVMARQRLLHENEIVLYFQN